MPELFTNNAKSTLASGITAGATALAVQTGEGALFPNPTAPDFFFATLEEGSTREIVKVTARSGDSFSTIVRAQQGTSAASFSAGAKVELRLTAAGVRSNRVRGGGAFLTVAPSADQDDYSPTGLADAQFLFLNPSASIRISGLAAPADEDQLLTIVNKATDRLVILTREDPASSAANRFNWPAGTPVFLLPGSSAQLFYNHDENRWNLVDSDRARLTSQLTWEDFFSAVGIFSQVANGTGASWQQVADGNDGTERTFACQQLDTGTTNTGRASASLVLDGTVVPALGQALFLCRIRVPTLSTGTQRFQVRAGFHDGAFGTDVADGVYWEYDDAAASVWRRCCAAASSRSKADATPTVDTNYIWLGIYITPDWTRADFFYSTDSVDWNFDGSQSGANMPDATTDLTGLAVTINKTVGTTQRDLNLDGIGFRYDIVRG